MMMSDPCNTVCVDLDMPDGQRIQACSTNDPAPLDWTACSSNSVHIGCSLSKCVLASINAPDGLVVAESSACRLREVGRALQRGTKGRRGHDDIVAVNQRTPTVVATSNPGVSS